MKRKLASIPRASVRLHFREILREGKKVGDISVYRTNYGLGDSYRAEIFIGWRVAGQMTGAETEREAIKGAVEKAKEKGFMLDGDVISSSDICARV